jgi:Zn-dependent metalloprotease
MLVILLNVLLLTISGSALSQATPAPRQATDATGKTRLLSFDAGPLGMPVREARATALTASADAIARYASAFGATAGSSYAVLSDFTLNTSAAGTTAVRYRQTIGGVPVYGSQLVVNVRGDGAVTLMSGETSSATGLNLSPALASSTAGQAALTYVAARYGVAAETLVIEDGGLWVYDPALIKPGASSIDPAGLVWKVVVTSTVGQPIRVEALIDAVDASVRFSFNRIHASPRTHTSEGVNFGAGLIGPAAPLALPASRDVRVGGSPDLATYDANNLQTLPGTFLCNETDMTCTDGVDTDADNAHIHAKGTYDFYWDIHGRDSLDNSGMQLISTVHFATNYCNAFWNGTQMAYGDGCNIVIDDVVGHELTHGVTEFSSNLIYAYDSGAINESFSDVWGEYYDIGNGTAEDIAANRWVIGEEIQTNGFRDMEDPTIWGDPDRVGSPNFWTDARDIGGVHINSGINNKAAYLMADGGTFNGQTITGLGMTKPLHIYYYVQTMLATEGTTYNDLAVYLAAACDALIGGAAGITSGDCDQVDKIVLATEMALPSPHLPDSAPVCSTGQTAINLFFDDFENTTTSANYWGSASISGANTWTISSDQNPLIGSRSLHADNIGGETLSNISSSVARMKADIKLPANAYLHFSHQYAWEYDGWDGGVVQYSTNGGSTWKTFTNAMMEGEQYPGRANGDSSIPLAGQFAYTGESFGSASTRINLSSLSGDNIRIRFFAASDEAYSYGNPDGWWIDDVRIYTCVVDTTAGTELLTNGGFETAGVAAGIPAGWTIQKPSGDKRACPANLNNVQEGSCAFKFTGSSTDASKLTQVVDISGSTFSVGDALTASAFFKGNNPTAKIKVTLFVTYTGNPTPVKTNLNVLRNAGFNNRRMADYILTNANVSEVKLVFNHLSSAGTIWLDNASLLHTPASNRRGADGFRGNN